MPKPLSVDREEVRATFLATGSLTEAARAHNLKEATVRQWAKRGKWETVTNAIKLRKKAEEIIEIKREKGHPDVSGVSRSADALRIFLENTASEFKTNMAGALARSSGALAELDAMSLLDNSRRMKDLADTAARVFPNMEGSERGVQVNLLALGAEALVAGGGER